MRPIPAHILMVSLLAMLAACATAPGPAEQAEAPAVPARAVLVAIRPVPALPPGALLAPLAGPTGGEAVELVARMPDGRAVSVVQPDAGSLRPGDAIILVSGPPTRMTAAN